MVQDSSLQQERVEAAEVQQGVVDPLLESLVFLSKYHHRPTSRDALISGLPLDNGRLTVDLFSRCASRVGLSARIVRRPLKSIPDFVLPAVLLMKNGECCVLTAWRQDGQAEVVLPDSGEGTTVIPLDTLEEDYLGYTLYVRPEYQFDARMKEEEDERPQNRSWFWGTLARLWPVYLQVMGAAAVVNVLAIASPLFVMNVYDRVLPNQAFSTLWVLAAGMGIAMFFDFLLRNLRAALIDNAGRRADVLLASRLFEQVLNIQMKVRPGSTGAFANHLREFETVRDFFTSSTLASLTDLMFVGLFLFIIWMIGGPLVYIPLAAVVLALVTGFCIQFPLNAVVRKTHKEAAQKHGILVETLSGLDTIKVAGAEGRMQRSWEQFVGSTSRTAQRSRLFSNFGINTTSFLQQGTTVGIVIFGVYLASEGEMSMGAIIACVILGGRAVAPLGGMANTLSRMNQSIVALKTLDGIMKLPVERPVDRRFVSRGRMNGEIEFRGVNFTYPEARTQALREVSFRVNQGERVGILGRIGSGKTTIGRLASGLYEPDEGAVLLDGTDLRQIHPADIRRNVGFMMQDVTLFYGTVRENIALGFPQADDALILRASKLAGVDDFVGAHPEGYDMVISERGQNLSGGQRQAISLARALLTDPPTLVLDEPTSAMDVASEQAMINRLREVLDTGRTLILATHRTSLLNLVDRLIVMDRGRLVADGPRDEVMNRLRGGKFRVEEQ
ncbi:type I secretion system permease/ATPase [Fodinicurvata fenggangensis]|uniref:type I secretion system permease/ATPase n=1 Tax=Fodinicurvata fenggangensis TaxID=1121830 RepID=UPI00047D076E|nr:type I secretion system permease/ATPase [Fodinicurvata fenggangensis]